MDFKKFSSILVIISLIFTGFPVAPSFAGGFNPDTQGMLAPQDNSAMPKPADTAQPAPAPSSSPKGTMNSDSLAPIGALSNPEPDSNPVIVPAPEPVVTSASPTEYMTAVEPKAEDKPTENLTVSNNEPADVSSENFKNLTQSVDQKLSPLEEWLKENSAPDLLEEGQTFFVADFKDPLKPVLKQVVIPASLLKEAMEKFPDFFEIQNPAAILVLLDKMYEELFKDLNVSTPALLIKTRNDLAKENNDLIAQLNLLGIDPIKNKEKIAELQNRLRLIGARLQFLDKLKELGLDPGKIKNYTQLLNELKKMLDDEKNKKPYSAENVAKLQLKLASAAALFLTAVTSYKSRANNPSKCVNGSCDGSSCANCEGSTLLQAFAFLYIGIPSGYWQGYTSGSAAEGHIANVIQTADGKYYILDQGYLVVDEKGIPIALDPAKLPKTLKSGDLIYIFDKRHELVIGNDPIKLMGALAVANLIAMSKDANSKTNPDRDPAEALRLALAALKTAKAVFGPNAGKTVKVGVTITKTTGGKVETIEATLDDWIAYLSDPKVQADKAKPAEPAPVKPLAPAAPGSEIPVSIGDLNYILFENGWKIGPKDGDPGKITGIYMTVSANGIATLHFIQKDPKRNFEGSIAALSGLVALFAQKNPTKNYWQTLSIDGKQLVILGLQMISTKPKDASGEVTFEVSVIDLANCNKACQDDIKNEMINAKNAGRTFDPKKLKNVPLKKYQLTIYPKDSEEAKKYPLGKWEEVKTEKEKTAPTSAEPAQEPVYTAATFPPLTTDSTSQTVSYTMNVPETGQTVTVEAEATSMPADAVRRGE